MIPNSVTPLPGTSPSASSIPFTLMCFNIDFTFEFKSGLIHVRIERFDNNTILKIFIKSCDSFVLSADGLDKGDSRVLRFFLGSIAKESSRVLESARVSH